MKQREMTPQGSSTGWSRVRTILVPTDFSPRTDTALAYALGLARQFRAEVHLLHVIGPLEGEAYSPLRYTPEAAVLHHDPQKNIYDLLEATLARHDSHGVEVELVKQRGIKPAPAILDYARREHIDLMIIGTHGAHGVRRLWLGSVAEEIIHQAPCNVLVVHERDTAEAAPRTIKRVLTPIDFSPPSRMLIEHAQALAALYNAEVDLLHVIETPSFLKPITGLATLGDLAPDVGAKAEAYLTQLCNEAADASVSIRTHLDEGQPAARIVHHAQTHATDLIVMATRGLSGLKRLLLGSVTERVVRAAPCPVLCVKLNGASSSETTEHAVPEAEETE